MRVLRLTGLLAVCCVAVSVWAEGFLGQLSPEQKQRLGLDQLTPAQRAELDAAIESYRRTGEVAAARMAAEAAVAEYRKQEEPGVISRALEVFKRNAEDRPAAEAERVTAVLQGKFTGWSGNTLFRLDNCKPRMVTGWTTRCSVYSLASAFRQRLSRSPSSS